MSEINTEEMYKIIKKQNGEEFAKILRENILLDIPNLKHILEYAGKNPADALRLVPILREIKISSQGTKETIKQETKDPIELLSDAGFDAFYVTTEKQKNSISKYYRPGEEICTIRDPHRHENFFIIHAVKRGAEKIKPSEKPERDDNYGTSVISIQIAKSGGFISIKNRYNHTVNNPDATFNNNPDNIIPGLTESLKRKFGVDFTTHDSVVPDNYRLVKDQLVRFNYEMNNVYFDEKYYFDGSSIKKLNPDYELMLDTVILDTRTSTIRNVLETDNYQVNDLFNVLNDELSGHKVKTEKDKKTGETIVNIIDENKNVSEFLRVKNGCISSLHLYKTTETGYRFMEYNKTLKNFSASKLKKMGRYCLSQNEIIDQLYIPELEEMDSHCFQNNTRLKEFVAPKLKKMGCSCFENNELIERIHMSELESLDVECFRKNINLKELIVPRLKHLSLYSFANSRNIENLYIPELETMSEGCFMASNKLKILNAPKLKKMHANCFARNEALEELHIPELEQMDSTCFEDNLALKELFAPKLERMGYNCFLNSNIENLFVPKLKKMHANCFKHTKKLKKLYAPILEITEHSPECIRRFIKLANLKMAVKNVLHLSNSADNIIMKCLPSTQKE